MGITDLLWLRSRFFLLCPRFFFLLCFLSFLFESSCFSSADWDSLTESDELRWPTLISLLLLWPSCILSTEPSRWLDAAESVISPEEWWWDFRQQLTNVTPRTVQLQIQLTAHNANMLNLHINNSEYFIRVIKHVQLKVFSVWQSPLNCRVAIPLVTASNDVSYRDDDWCFTATFVQVVG